MTDRRFFENELFKEKNLSKVLLQRKKTFIALLSITGRMLASL